MNEAQAADTSLLGGHIATVQGMLGYVTRSPGRRTSADRPINHDVEL
jgi:hypothetical protein